MPGGGLKPTLQRTMNTKPLLTDRLSGWHLLAAAVLGALGVAITWDAWVEIYQYARHDEEAQHIFIVLPVVWLVTALGWMARSS